MLAIGGSAFAILTRPLNSGWLLLAALTLLTGSFSIKLPGVHARISVSEAFVFATVLLFGPAAATVVVTLDALVLTSWKRASSRSRLRGLFSMSAGATAIWGAAHIFMALHPALPAAPNLGQFLFPVVALAISYFVINSALVAIAVAFESNRSPFSIWHQNFAWLSLNYLGGASVATLLVTYTKNIDLTALGIIVPLLVITYLTFRTSLGRLEDAHRHIAQVNDLYFSTIEALAMAVDAKDQITHGHIRRVQFYAVGLAKHLGVTDALQLKAIEAAALLHDMGKLAIPEHILNKPGKLSAAEFETMKTHAKIGADLLSSIPFPYPVVPIVRHHHEQWDGKGYPDRISGPDIPLGARILSVVDCFDALNSDRPYRPKLSVEESFKILSDRRGNMYDPLVVDTFIACYEELAEGAQAAGENARTLIPSALDAPQVPSGPSIDVNTNNDRAALADAGALALACSSEIDAFQMLANRLLSITPATICIYHEYSRDSDQLICVSTTGSGQNLLNSTVDIGDRISGWVAANKRTSTNSDPALELKDAIESFAARPRSTLSVPVVSGGELRGVITAFAPAIDAFSARHVSLVEHVATILGEYSDQGQARLSA